MGALDLLFWWTGVVAWVGAMLGCLLVILPLLGEYALHQLGLYLEVRQAAAQWRAEKRHVDTRSEIPRETAHRLLDVRLSEAIQRKTRKEYESRDPSSPFHDDGF